MSELFPVSTWFLNSRDQRENRRGFVAQSFSGLSRGRLIAGASCLASWIFLSCGSIGEPLPPLLHIPGRAEGLSVKQTAEGIVLEWTPPLRTTEAMPLRYAPRFAIHRLTLSRPDETVSLERFERESREVASVEGREVGEPAAGGRLGVTLELPRPRESSFVYGVRVEGRRGHSAGFSNLAAIEVVEGPAKPGRPTLTLRPEGILVEWEDAARASSYQVLRGSDAAGEPTLSATVDGTRFLDRRFVEGERYVYRVRSLRSAFTGDAEGPLGPGAEIAAEDVFPPAPPRGLTAVPTDSGVELSWRLSTEPDLAGYRVYRGTGTGPIAGEREELLANPRFADRGVLRGETYRYVVTAVDRAGNESEASEAVRVAAP